MVRIHGQGSGGLYPFCPAETGGLQGPDHREILVEGTSGPLALYHARLQYTCGRAEMEIRDASNIALYGVKHEGYSTVLRVTNADHVLVVGYGGPACTPETGKFILEHVQNVDLVNVINDSDDGAPFPCGGDTRASSLVRAQSLDGKIIESGPDEKPALFKITSGRD
jgi:hypothetical protein